MANRRRRPVICRLYGTEEPGNHSQSYIIFNEISTPGYVHVVEIVARSWSVSLRSSSSNIVRTFRPHVSYRDRSKDSAFAKTARICQYSSMKKFHFDISVDKYEATLESSNIFHSLSKLFAEYV